MDSEARVMERYALKIAGLTQPPGRQASLSVLHLVLWSYNKSHFTVKYTPEA